MTDRIPAEIQMRTDTYGDGAKGMAFQIDNDTAGLGVNLTVRREKRGAPWVPVWRYRWLPDRTFSTFPELRDAVNALDDASIEAEKQRWPQHLEADREPSPTAKCWLDGVEGCRFITVRSSWHEYASAPLCPACESRAKTDPRVVIEAVEARVARVRSRPSLTGGGPSDG